MKKILALILGSLLALCVFASCNAKPEAAPVENKQEDNNNVKVVSPLPASIDMDALDNCTVAVSLEEGGAYVDDEGKMVMDVTVYAYDLYDMVDIASLAKNDVIVRLGEEVKVASIERLDTGLININGGEENGGFSLISNDSTVYYEVGMSDAKAYYEIGKATLPVFAEFVYTDESNLDAEPVEYFAGDFLAEDVITEYNFNPNNTSIVIQDGYIVAMKKVYTP